MKNLEILFWDDCLAVVRKPAGLLSQPDPSGRENLISLLEAQLGAPIFPVHRLDRETEGVLVYARTKAAAASLSAQIAAHKFEKEYLAIAEHPPQPLSGVMEDFLFRDAAKNKSFVVKRERRGVKRARLSYETLVVKAGKALVQIHLDTGRTHQIRVQFASRRIPLVGDRKYGGSPADTLALFCQQLSFFHPQTGAPLSFSLPLPPGPPWEGFSSQGSTPQPRFR